MDTQTQAHIHVERLEAVITVMAWNVVEKIFEEQQKKQASMFLHRLDTEASKRTQALIRLKSKKGTWDRGSGPYRVIGAGKKPETFYLENVTTGKKISATLKTLAFRWRHTP